jgi:hypothetical protein
LFIKVAGEVGSHADYDDYCQNPCDAISHLDPTGALFPFIFNAVR